MNIFFRKYRILCSQSGATAVIVAVMLTTLVGFAALVVDLGYLYAERNRLQNAADAGALTGARVLYAADGKSINKRADIIANVSDVSPKNVSTGTYVVNKGHYSFGMGTIPRGFQVNNDDTLTPVVLWNVSEKQLDETANFINSVQVAATMNAPSFFSTIWNYAGFQLSVNAVAYIGFAGTVEPLTFDEPIAICMQAITSGGNYTCNIGRMLADNSDTAAWTTFEQPCQGAANSDVLKDILTPCPTNGANENPVVMGSSTGIETTNGVNMSVFKLFYDCWKNGKNKGVSIDTDKNGIPDQPWKMTLAVIDCVPKDPNCGKVIGAVEINVVWILEKENDDSPYQMGGWSNASPDDATRWNSFVAYFKLTSPVDEKNPLAPLTAATKQQKTIYFLPDCTPHEPAGSTGGKNYGILSKIPVLVQ